MKNAYEYFAELLGVSAGELESLDRVMTKSMGRRGIFQKLQHENEKRVNSLLGSLQAKNRDFGQTTSLLKDLVIRHETQFRGILQRTEGANQFEKAARLARKVARDGMGFFLKKEYARKILESRPPEKLLEYLGYKSVMELLQKEDVTEIFAALRFVESDAWMHETFERAYSNFTAADFEEREIEVKVLGSQWGEIAKKFVAKKHHNVSHLKEFGVIFINPISEDIPGKLLRDFALLLHYFHEIVFYSELFQYYAPRKDFAERLKSLLRGDVKEQDHAGAGEWLIVQRYLVKENPQDPRLFIPRVNPESLHWMRGERDLVNFGLARHDLDLEMWQSLDWVGTMARKTGQIVSFDLEDAAMSEVSSREGKHEFFTYHQREALWTKLFMEYVGGEEETQRLLIENYEFGRIQF